MFDVNRVTEERIKRDEEGEKRKTMEERRGNNEDGRRVKRGSKKKTQESQ